MKASNKLIEAIKRFEGCRLKAYKCPAGVWTIGYGTTKGVYAGMEISYTEAERLLRRDLTTFENYVSSLGVCTTQGQFDALTDFSYNVGTGNLGSSTLLKYIRAGRPYEDIKAQFMRWNKSKGKVLKGLTNRREWEAKRYTEQ